MANIVMFLITILIAFVAGSKSYAQTKVVIAHAAMSPRVAPAWIAQDHRFYAKYGVNAEVVNIRTAPVMLAAIAGGEVQIGYTGGTAALGAAVGGTELRILATWTNRVTYDLVARPEIKSPQDLRGMRFGVQSIGGTVWMGAILGLEYLGLEPVRDKIKILVVGDQSVLTQALATGTIDATVLDSSFSVMLRQKGFSILAEFSKVDIPFSSLGLVAKKEYIDKNPSLIEGALKSMLEGNAYALSPTNKASTLASLQRRLRLGDDNAKETAYNDMLTGLARKPYPSVAGLRNIQRLMAELNPKVAKIDIGPLNMDRFVRALDQSGFIDKVLGSYGVR